MAPPSYLAAFAALAAETQAGRRLSTTVLPEVEAAALYDAIVWACEDEASPLRAALDGWRAGASLADAVANQRPSETLAGKLDGQAAVCVVLALLLCEHDAEAAAAVAACSQAPEDEFEVATHNTDTNPLGEDADPVQRALMDVLRGECGAPAKLAAAAYGRAAAYGDKAALLTTCASFVYECGTLLGNAHDVGGKNDEATPTSPKNAFYTSAEHPFASPTKPAAIETPPLPPAPEQPPPPPPAPEQPPPLPVQARLPPVRAQGPARVSPPSASAAVATASSPAAPAPPASPPAGTKALSFEDDEYDDEAILRALNLSV
jgi:hypothetical protein